MKSLNGFILPDDFLIGTANSAFQSEGAWRADGKSESIMEYYAREWAGKTPPHLKTLDSAAAARQARQVYSDELPDRGCFFYDNYEAYIEDMQKTGQNVYRMSLAWPRIIPTGIGEVNFLAIDFYNRVINKLIACGITPFVDIYHWDLPQCLMEQGGFANPAFPDWFEAYARVCFENFGDRVKMWSTFNESSITVTNGYITQRFPPFIKDIKLGQEAALNVVLAHYRAVRLYKSMNLGGKIGAVNCITDVTPAGCNWEDIGAAERQTQRNYDWWMEPMLKGTYPEQLLRESSYIRENMPDNYAARLDAEFIPMDFVGINYYVSGRTMYLPDTPLLSKRVESFYSAPGQAFAPYPAGMFDVVQYTADRYGNPEMYITENGCALPNRNDPDLECDDEERITYIREHLRMAARLIRCGYNLRGYMYWNDADSYEELDGYNLRFGLTWVNHKTGERRWKKSRYYFSEICKTHLVN